MKLSKDLLVKFGPIVLAGVAAAVGAIVEGIGKQQEEDRINELEDRLNKLEAGER